MMNEQNYPNRIVVELTSECNLSCHVCPRKYMKQKKGYISKKLWIKLIEEIAEYAPGSVVIPFWRGESLLHPDFCDLIELALASSLRLHMSTNGIMVDNRNSRVMAECEFVSFSVHTTLGYNNAKKFLKYKNGKYPVIQVSFVEGEQTMKKICRSIIDSPNLEDFDSVRVFTEHSKDGVFGSSCKNTGLKRFFCPKLKDTLVIAYDGTISRCCYIWETIREINVNNMSIREAWDSEHLQQIRENYPDQKCRSCDQWTGNTCGESWQNEHGKIRHNHFNLEN